jgi:hypothetical protein
MIKHGKKILVTVDAVSALAFGGAALANAGSTPLKPAACASRSEECPFVGTPWAHQPGSAVTL